MTVIILTAVAAALVGGLIGRLSGYAESRRLQGLLERAHRAYEELRERPTVRVATGDRALDRVLLDELCEKVDEINAYNREASEGLLG